MPVKPEVLLPERLVAARYNVTTRTLRRWDSIPALAFPPPRYIRKRRYRSVPALDAWDRETSKRAAGLLATAQAATNHPTT